jgi:GNAT superfamily N-acetyltransferase
LSPAWFVRDARSGDLDVIVGFNERLASESEGKVLDRAVLERGVRAALADPDRLRYWVAERVGTGEVVGQAAVTREWSDWRNGWLWWFQSVYVQPDARRQGVFRALFARIRTTAREAGDVVGLRLYVEDANRPAQATYGSVGMTPGGYHVYEEIWPDRFGGL